MAIYKGFSTVGKNRPPFIETDIELIKIDLMNHINTRKGERFMRPNFGSIIHELIMDPLDFMTKEAILNDLNEIIRSEPRVELLSPIIIEELDYGVRVEIELFFNQYDKSEILLMDFKRDLQNDL